MEAGTGKTRVACDLINSVDCIDRVVWFGPLRTIRGDEGTVPQEVNRWGLKAPVMYFGVESISASDRIYMEAVNAVKTADNPFVVVDESLKIKNAMAKRTKRLLYISTLVQYKLILNGTPMSRNIMDMWAQMEFLSPRILNMSLSQFKDVFCNYKIIEKKSGCRTFRKEIITGFENVDYLNSLIRHYVYECDLKLNIRRNYHEMRYTIDDWSRNEYEEIKAEMLSDEFLEFRNNNIFIEMTNKMQHAYCVTEDKFRCVECILDCVPHDKVIIFTRYIKSAEECAKRWPDVKVLSYQKESLGLNLQQYHHTIYFDKIWDYALRNQSWHRTFRVGQEHDCQYWDLTGNVGLERMIDRNIEKKTSMTEYFKRVSREQLMQDL